jgi:hypothetical protein
MAKSASFHALLGMISSKANLSKYPADPSSGDATPMVNGQEVCHTARLEIVDY